jgi:hypothetical protein
MKAPLLLPFGTALALGSAAAAYADKVILFWPLIPGPSGYLGPHMPGSRPTSVAPLPIRRAMPQASVSARNHMPDRVPLPAGELDETGRIGPTVPFERDADGKLLPTYPPR